MPLGKCDGRWKAYVTCVHDDKIAMAEITNAEGELIGCCDMDCRVVFGEFLPSDLVGLPVDTCADDDECDEIECAGESWCRLRRCCEMRLMLAKDQMGVAQELQRCRVKIDTRRELQKTGRRRMIANECLAVISDAVGMMAASMVPEDRRICSTRRRESSGKKVARSHTFFLMSLFVMPSSLAFVRFMLLRA